MSESAKSVAIPMGGGVSEKRGFPVKVTDSPDTWVEFQLEDGTIMKHKVVLLAAFRVENDFDSDGTPTYACQMANFIMKDATGYHGPRGPSQLKGEVNAESNDPQA